jgi:hypothetical protein
MHIVVADMAKWFESLTGFASEKRSVLVLGTHTATEPSRKALGQLARAHGCVALASGATREKTIKEGAGSLAGVEVFAVAPQTDVDRNTALLSQVVGLMPRDSDLIYAGQRAPFVGVVAQHKSGTHLIARLMEAAGYKPFGIGIHKGPPPDGYPDWIAWEDAEFDNLGPDTAYFSHSLPFMTMRKPGEQYRTLLKRWLERDFPLLFHYRDPRAVLSSVKRYCMNQIAGSASTHGAWIRVMGGVLRGLPDDDARLTACIELLGDYMERQYRDNLWMLLHPRVIRTTYEALAGLRAGGSRARQLSSVAQTMVRLGIGGSPVELASSLYSEDVRTFSRGRIEGWRKDFKQHHLELFEKRFGDLRTLYGY